MNEHGSGALALTVALMTSSTVLLMPWASMYSCVLGNETVVVSAGPRTQRQPPALAQRPTDSTRCAVEVRAPDSRACSGRCNASIADTRSPRLAPRATTQLSHARRAWILMVIDGRRSTPLRRFQKDLIPAQAWQASQCVALCICFILCAVCHQSILVPSRGMGVASTSD